MIMIMLLLSNLGNFIDWSFFFGRYTKYLFKS